MGDDGAMREVLAAWGPLTVVGPISGGNRNTVLELLRGRQRLVARRSRREPASLDWEIALLGHLSRRGIRVPAVIPAADGRLHVDGVVVQSWLAGAPPGPADWPAVADTLRRVHAVTAGWPQRPGSASTRELLTADRGGDVDLSLMPPDAVTDCRRAWARLAGTPEAVVHGDPGAPNIRVTAAGVGLLDWDEARLDYTDLDLAELPGYELPSRDLPSRDLPRRDLPRRDLPGRDLPPGRLAAARTAATAWEAANGWTVEPAYARRQLSLLRARRDGFGREPR
jgi:aminoglycoside phosphotransferase (APT) family kinase protein